MSSIKLSPNASGTGIFTIAAPNSNTDRTLTLPDASGTFLTNSGTEAGAFSTLSVNSNNISAVNSLGFRNRIINGDCRIDQRNAGASVTPTAGTYTLDRWGVGISAASKFSIQRNAGSVTPPVGFTNYLGVTSLSAYTPASGDYFSVYQVVEGFNIADLNWGTANAQTVTVSFWVRSSLTGTFGGSVSNGVYTRTYPFSYTVSAANTWEQKTVTIPGDTTGTWATDNTAGLAFKFGLSAGSTYTGTANTWAATNYIYPTGSVNILGTNGATFYITGVQLEAGSVATPFERRDYGRELIMCQRYYQKYTSMLLSAYSTSATNYYNTVLFPVELRATPTINYSNFSNNNSSNAITNAVTTKVWRIQGTITSTGSGYSTFDAETSGAEL